MIAVQTFRTMINTTFVGYIQAFPSLLKRLEESEKTVPDREDLEHTLEVGVNGIKAKAWLTLLPSG